ncbi:MAG: ANTAR domain-containing response regulator [Longimicrobiales bacterium]
MTRTNHRRARTGARILVAEDEPLNALALKAQLEALGFQVIGPASNGRQAIDLAAQNPLDLAILDIRMPEVSGITAAAEIFRLQPLPILLLSGYSTPEFIKQAAELPVFHYLVKPVTMEDLVPAISVARARFREWSDFRAEARELQQKLDDRQLVERAKSLLMQNRGLSEPDAYRLLQRESQNRNQPMAEIARSILLTRTILGSDQR